MRYLYFFVVISCLLSVSAVAQCDPATEAEVRLVLILDNYPSETSWSLTGASGTEYASGDGYNNSNVGDTIVTTVCVGLNDCITFYIEDDYGDGICCSYGEGGYEVFLNDVSIAQGGNFDEEEQFSFNCPPGSNCGSALPMDGAAFYDTGSDFENTWYEFVPDSTGIYLLTTHFDVNSCDNSIWLYDYCIGLDWADGYEGSLFFNDDKKDGSPLAEVTSYLSAGTTYWIRVGSISGDCGTENIRWAITYEGPISGCTDPNSCNYEPLATLDDGSCMAWGDPDCPNAPDLVAIQEDFQNSMFIDYITNADGCMVNEGCLAGYGTRELLRFDTRIENVGDVDFYIGTPPSSPSQADEQWEWDDCHNHWHYESYAEYVAYTEAGTAIPIGFKNGFCVMDLDCSMNGGNAKYNCGNQGITAQCGDIYAAYLDCQWFDITDLPAGQYTFAMKVNWDQSPDAVGRVESDFFNNWAQVCINLTRDPVSNEASFTFIDDCQPYTDCAGTVYGNAQPDCEGTCAGTRLTGDLNQDTLRTIIDIDMYIDEALQGNMQMNACNDLNGDGDITITDAALLVECVLHEGSTNLPGHAHKPCEFPHNLTNESDTVFLSITEVSSNATGQNFATVSITNPQSRVMALQFKLADLGASISGVEPLLPDFNATWAFSDREIVVVSPQENSIGKHNEPTPMLNIYFNAPLTPGPVCLEEIRAAVNLVRDEVITVIGECSEVISSTREVNDESLRAQVIPNPATDRATLRFTHTLDTQYDLAIYDGIGRQVRFRRDLRDREVQLDLADLTPGIYRFQVRTPTGVYSDSFVVGW